MMDKGKRKKIDQDSSEDENPTWIDSFWESLVSQSSQTTQGNPVPVGSPTTPIATVNPAAAPSPIGRARQLGRDGGPFPALSDPNNVVAETGVHRYVPARPGDQEVARLQQHLRRPQQDRQGPFIGDSRQLYGSGYGLALFPHTTSPVAEPSTYPPDPPVPGLQHRAGITQASLMRQQWLLQASRRGYPPPHSVPTTPVVRTGERAPANHPSPDGRARPRALQPQPWPTPPLYFRERPVPPLGPPLSPTTNVSSPLSPLAHQQSTHGAESPGADIPIPQHQHSDGSWSCRYETCSNQRQRYRLQSELRKHQRNHEERPFPCDRDQCRFSARFAGHLANHKESVHGDAVYYCPRCPKSYPRHDNLGRHVREKHPRTRVPSKEEARVRPAPVEAAALLRHPGPVSSVVPDPRVNTTPMTPAASTPLLYIDSTSNRPQPYASPSLLGTNPYPLRRAVDIDPSPIYQQRGNPSTPSRQSVYLSLLQGGASVDRRPPDWPALPSQQEPDTVSYFNTPSSNRRLSSAARTPYAGLPTPPLSRGSSVSRRRDRSRTRSLLSPPQTPSSQRRSAGYPLYSDVAAAAMPPTPPSSEASAARRGSGTGHRYSTQTLVYRSRITSPMFGLDPRT